MKCKKALKWIALYREGELGPGIQKRLAVHLAKCESCGQIFQAYMRNSHMAAQIRSRDPEPYNEANITDRIMDTVENMKNHPGETNFAAMIYRLPDLLMLPFTRRIALACIVIITVTFGFQQYYVYSRITLLEKQLSSAGKTFLAKAGKSDMEDCIRKSARYLSRIKAYHGETEKNLRKYFRENPDKMNLYMSLLCSRQYRSLKKHVNQDYIVVQDFITNYQSEIE